MRFHESVPASTRLAVTLRYLKSGESQHSLSWSFRLDRTTVSKIVRETCEVIWKVLSPIYLCSPSTEQEWKQISNDFEEIWNLPHCIGQLTGNTLQLNVPKNLDQDISTTKAVLALSFWQSVMPNTASHL